MRALPFSGLMGFQFVLFGWLVKHAVSFVGHSRHCSFSRHASPSGWEVKHQQDYQHRHEVSRRAATTNTEESTSSSSTEETLFDLLTSPETKQLLSMPGCSVVDVTLEDHRPLGCVVEESLASPPWTTLSKTPNSALPLVLKPKDGSNSGNTLVFVATVHAGGAAALSGIRPGDVICGVSSVMDSALLQDVTGSGMDVVYVRFLLLLLVGMLCLCSFAGMRRRSLSLLLYVKQQALLCH